MNYSIKISNIVNCGLLIESANAKILVDGLNGFSEYFNEVPDKIANEIVNGTGVFEGLDFMLYTHCHNDHFDGSKVLQCVWNQNLKGLFLPNDPNVDVADLRKILTKTDMLLIEPALKLGEKQNFTVADIEVTYFKTLHSGKEFSNVPHYSFVINIEDNIVYVSGDANFSEDYQVKMLDGIGVTAAFFNPFYLSTITGRSIIKGINAKHNYIYHVPFLNGDIFQIRKQAIINFERYKESLPDCHLILHEMEEIYKGVTYEMHS